MTSNCVLATAQVALALQSLTKLASATTPTCKSTSTNPADYTLPRNTAPENADLFRARSPNLQFFDASTLGEFIITYTATDSAGYTSTVTRTIIVEDDLTLPVISLNGNEEIQIEAGTEYTDAGATVADRRGNALDAGQIKTNGTVDPAKLGTYTITYDYSTEQGATALTVKRKVIVADTTAPTITLNGEAEVILAVDSEYTDAGAIASDNFEGELIVTTSHNLPPDYTVIDSALHYAFDEGQDTISNEAKGDASLAATLGEGITWTEGVFGKALQFPTEAVSADIPDFPFFADKKLFLSLSSSIRTLSPLTNMHSGSTALFCFNWDPAVLLITCACA